MKRNIIAFRKYYKDFMVSLTNEEQNKVRKGLLILENNEKIPYHYIKFIRDGIY